jgi:KaiC/GvpD/RAD55 family RecA-like ATPase
MNETQVRSRSAELSSSMESLSMSKGGRIEEGSSEKSLENVAEGRGSGDLFEVWENSETAKDDHPFFSDKRRKPRDCRETVVEGIRTLTIPAYDAEFRVIGIELVEDAERKRYVGRRGGAFHLYGDIPQNGKVILCSGAATAAILHQMSDYPVCDCMDPSNIPVVERSFDGLRSRLELIIAVDSDEAGRMAADECEAMTVIPDASMGRSWYAVLSAMDNDEAKEFFRKTLLSAWEKQPRRKVLRSFRTYIDTENSALPEKIGGLFHRGAVVIVAGEPGCGKTLFMQKFVCDVSLGRGVKGETLPPRKVLYLLGEMPIEIWNERQKTTGWPFDTENIAIYCRADLNREGFSLDLTEDEGFGNLKQIARGEKPGILIIDSLMSFLKCNESNMTPMQKVLGGLSQLAHDLNIAIVLVHHIRKRTDSQRKKPLHMNDVIGSSIISRDAATVLGMQQLRLDDGSDIVRVTSLKSWYGQPEDFAFRIVCDGAGVLQGILFERDRSLWETTSNKTEAIHRIVFKGHADGSEFTVAEISSATDTTDSYVRRLLQGWMKLHRVERLGGGRDTRYRLTEKYRTDEQDTGDELDSNVGQAEPIILKSESVLEENMVILTAEEPSGDSPVSLSNTDYTDFDDTELKMDVTEEQDSSGAASELTRTNSVMDEDFFGGDSGSADDNEIF